MLTKIPKKGLNAVLIVSLLGLGTGYNLPTAYAEETVTQVSQTANTLAKLEIEGVKLDKDFTSEINQYSATVENETNSIHILVEGSNTNSIISINDKTITSGTAEEYALQSGQNIFLITVKDSSTNLTNTYTLTVIREQNSNSQLQNIKLSTGKLSPAFSSTVTEYNVDLPNAQTITVLPAAVEKTAVVEVNGAEVTEKGVPVNIPVGKSDILIVVTAENGSKLRYTIHVERQDTSSGKGTNSAQTGSGSSTEIGNNGSSAPSANNGSVSNENSGTVQTGSSGSAKSGRGLGTQTGNSFLGQGNTTNQSASSQQGASAAVEKTSNATLSKLTVSTGTWDSSFTSSEYTYHIAVSSDIKTVKINPTASDSSSEITIEGGTSKTIQLDDDNKTVISVRVTYDDTDRKTYVLVIDKADS
ncbi:cadherin-like beta sandwich domain-containing protein [Neobacillus cucumis]|uniref:cadherin-like beta sandwich domain-containing protein n=1 Tax=Neobacillus cucumis TaxID=1740721 RepID=UPI00203EABED|nr:cadherin-like beta sandwich domain-containing protein [Neobacillus cucumis]MCM3728743.1 cadherin-like beta sandwich domain-containing protein [Neobacillus cucumis]